MRPLTDVISAIEAPRHFNTGLLTAFAASALLLAITGIYAVVASSVSQRTPEIAIRMTQGAQRAAIAKLVLISGAKLSLLGCALGVLGSRALATGQLLPVRRQRDRPIPVFRSCADDDAGGASGFSRSRDACCVVGPRRRSPLNLIFSSASRSALY